MVNFIILYFKFFFQNKYLTGNILFLLKLFETGFYLIADAEKNFYWDISNKLKDYPATALVFSHEYGDDYYVFGQPVYLYPTQTTDCYNKERVDSCW